MGAYRGTATICLVGRFDQPAGNRFDPAPGSREGEANHHGAVVRPLEAAVDARH